MYDAELKRMRELIRTRRYVMTLHAEDEMDADGLTIFDVESVILAGQITERHAIASPTNGSIVSVAKLWMGQW